MTWLVVTSFVVSALGGVVPFLNVELWVVGMAAGFPSALVPVVLATSLGQIAAKAVLYRTSSTALPSLQRSGPRVEGMIRRLAGHRESYGMAVVFVSALAGVPPFYLVSIAAGVSRFPFPRFLVLGLVGRLLRFALIFLLPRYLPMPNILPA